MALLQSNVVADFERIHDLLLHNERELPKVEAVVDGDVRLSYSELLEQVDQLAKALVAQGVSKGDRVATMAPPSKEFFLTYLAATSIGAIWHGLNPRYKKRDYAYLLEDAEPKIVFVFSPYDEREYDLELQALTDKVDVFVTIGSSQGRAVDWQNFLSRGGAIDDITLQGRRDAVEPEDIAVIVYTSGTTGEPKGAMLSHKAIARSAQINARWMGEGLRSAICPAPINHVGCLNNICMNVLAFGGTIIFFPRVDPLALHTLNQREKPSYMVTSPTGFNMLLSSPGFTLDLMRSTQLIVYGGATTSKSTLEAFVPLGANMASVYGQTETCGIVTSTHFDDSLEVKAETIGRGLEGVELRVVRPDGEDVDTEETGELLVRAPFVMSGYFNRPDATREAFTKEGYLRTGDLCKRRSDGNIEFVGRIKEMFKSGGYNIYPMEIEQAICEHPSVLMAAVLSIPDEKFQEVGYAFVAAVPGDEILPEELKVFLSERIANFKIPKYFEILPQLPILANSKIDKQSLRKRLNDLFQT